MRLGMGTWTFIIIAFGIMFAWISTNGWGGWDHDPFFKLNLGLSCMAALQCAILLIAAKRSDATQAFTIDHISRETDEIDELLTQNTALTREVHQHTARLSDLHRSVAALCERLGIESVPAEQPSAIHA